MEIVFQITLILQADSQNCQDSIDTTMRSFNSLFSYPP